ncbi:MAG: pantoate/beta-alanine ligase [Acidimicrobiia bacterium]|nr:pantoate/beta-alanine ligase [Acidimicrobiia bacterium]
MTRPAAAPEIFTTIASLREWLHDHRVAGRGIGFVPTMGALHQGHLTLIEAAVRANPVVVASIFVNPLQFAANEDLNSYPRDLDRDVDLATQAGVTAIFAPSVEEMYPQWPLLSSVSVSAITDTMEGAIRPHFFTGVATVVCKLFSIVGQSRAYFGEKDFQQLAVVRRMVADLSLPIEVVGVETVREADGLAMSSRNIYLDDVERRQAPVLYAALQAAAEAITGGERSAQVVRDLLHRRIEAVAPLDYAEVVDAATLERVDPLAGELRLLVAARFGKARLIDNIGVRA